MISTQSLLSAQAAPGDPNNNQHAGGKPARTAGKGKRAKLADDSNDPEDVPMRAISTGEAEKPERRRRRVRSKRGASEESVASEEDAGDAEESGEGVLDTSNRAGFCAHWLTTNFARREGVSVPRSGLFAVYAHACERDGKPMVNAATFGKIIRMVWPTVSTRRLGTRGNSKYHYYGIAPNGTLCDNILLHGDCDDEDFGEGDDEAVARSRSMLSIDSSEPLVSFVPISPPQPRNKRVVMHLPIKASQAGATNPATTKDDEPRQRRRPRHKRPDAETADEPPESVEQGAKALRDRLALITAPSTASSTALERFKEHCVQTYRLCRSRNFDAAVATATAFLASNPLGNDDSPDNGSRTALLLCQDSLFTELTDCLVPHVMSPLPTKAALATRRFAADYVRAVEGAGPSAPAQFVQATQRFGRALRQRIAVNQLAQAVEALLHDGHTVAAMLADWQRYVQLDDAHACLSDFVTLLEDTAEGAGLSSQWADACIRQLLEQRATLTEWTLWLDSLLEQILASQMPGLSRHPHVLLASWTLYGHYISRQLTVHSAASFGAWHLLTLLMTEYLQLVLAQRIRDLSASNAHYYEYPAFDALSQLVLQPPPDDSAPTHSTGHNSNHSNNNLLMSTPQYPPQAYGLPYGYFASANISPTRLYYAPQQHWTEQPSWKSSSSTLLNSSSMSNASASSLLVTGSLEDVGNGNFNYPGTSNIGGNSMHSASLLQMLSTTSMMSGSDENLLNRPVDNQL